MYRGSGHRLAQWEGVYSWSAIHHRLSNAISDVSLSGSRRTRDDTVLSAKQILAPGSDRTLAVWRCTKSSPRRAVLNAAPLALNRHSV